MNNSPQIPGGGGKIPWISIQYRLYFADRLSLDLTYSHAENNYIGERSK